MQYFRVALLAGGIISIPVITYQVLMFVLPGMTKRETRILLFSIPPVTLLFLVGVVFAWRYCCFWLDLPWYAGRSWRDDNPKLKPNNFPSTRWNFYARGQLPAGYKFYYWNNDDGYSNMGKWVEEAAKAAGRAYETPRCSPRMAAVLIPTTSPSRFSNGPPLWPCANSASC